MKKIYTKPVVETIRIYSERLLYSGSDYDTNGSSDHIPEGEGNGDEDDDGTIWIDAKPVNPWQREWGEKGW